MKIKDMKPGDLWYENWGIEHVIILIISVLILENVMIKFCKIVVKNIKLQQLLLTKLVALLILS